MKHTINTIFAAFVFASALFSAACSTMTEKEWEAREYARVEWQEQFRNDRRECLARGGNWVVDGTAELDRDDIPKRRVFYVCA